MKIYLYQVSGFICIIIKCQPVEDAYDECFTFTEIYYAFKIFDHSFRNSLLPPAIILELFPQK